jgi:hypothetical protein
MGYTIVSREPWGHNVRVHFQCRERIDSAVFYRRPGEFQIVLNKLFFGVRNVYDDDLVIRALAYVAA